jgi:hypothetical protein
MGKLRRQLKKIQIEHNSQSFTFVVLVPMQFAALRSRPISAVGMLASETPKGPMSLRFPQDTLEVLYPRLYPQTWSGRFRMRSDSFIIVSSFSQSPIQNAALQIRPL